MKTRKLKRQQQKILRKFWSLKKKHYRTKLFFLFQKVDNFENFLFKVKIYPQVISAKINNQSMDNESLVKAIKREI